MKALSFIILSIFFYLSLAVGCDKISFLRDAVERTPHEEYSEALVEAGLDESEIGRSWLSEAQSVLHNSLSIQLPYEETGWLPPDEVQAFAWRFSARKGQRLVVELETPPQNRGAIFVDLFVIEDGEGVEHLAGLDEKEKRLDRLAESDTSYVLRLQPELLAGGRYELKITLSPSLAFPVEGKDSAAIGSFFGDPRDGGSREHHGVDIFAPRGTKALAAADGIIYRTGVTPRGGKVVWLLDRSLDQSYYYAHLDSIAVGEGKYVSAGNPVGSIGNTGNARFTSPHLHFGIYGSGGPADPFYFIHEPDRLAGQTQVAEGELRGVSTVTAGRLRLREGPSTEAKILAELNLHTVIRLIAKSGDWYRVVLADGLQGYISARYIDATGESLGEIKIAEPRPVHANPASSAPEIGRVERGENIELYGKLNDFQYVKLPSGRFGWISLN